MHTSNKKQEKNRNKELGGMGWELFKKIFSKNICIYLIFILISDCLGMKFTLQTICIWN